MVCLSAPGTGPQGLSYLRFYLIDEIVADAPDAEAGACIRAALREQLSDEQVFARVTGGAGEPTVTRRIERLVARCSA